MTGAVIRTGVEPADAGFRLRDSLASALTSGSKPTVAVGFVRPGQRRVEDAALVAAYRLTVFLRR